MSTFSKWIVVLLLVGIFACVVAAAAGLTTDAANALLSVVLCLLSIIGTVMVSRAYAKQGHEQAIGQTRIDYQNSLRTYALNAAEKVTNLSNQLSSLAAFLQDDLDSCEFESADVGLRIVNERVGNAIQMINMLKSINDTALSDWQGVIGDELDEQREERAEETEKLRGLAERLERSLADARNSGLEQGGDVELHTELYQIRRSVADLTMLIGNPLRAVRRNKKAKQPVEGTCPACAETVRYEQRPRKSGVKAVNCERCQAVLISTFSPPAGFALVERKTIEEIVCCPYCSTETTAQLDNLIGTSESVQCANCTGEYLVARGKDGLRFKEKIHPPTNKLRISAGGRSSAGAQYRKPSGSD